MTDCRVVAYRIDSQESNRRFDFLHRNILKFCANVTFLYISPNWARITDGKKVLAAHTASVRDTEDFYC